MNCKISTEQLSLWIDGLLPQRDETMLKEHLSECSECQSRLQQLQLLNSDLEELGRWSRLRHTLAQQYTQSLWRETLVPWYYAHPLGLPSLVLGIVFLAIILPVYLSPANPKILKSAGEVTFASSKNTILHINEPVVTGSGYVAIRMGDGYSEVELGPETQATITGTRELSIEKGVLWNDVQHDSSKPYRIMTPFGIVRVLGTKFEVTVNDAAAEVHVLEGTVELTHSNSLGNEEKTLIYKGFSCIMSKKELSTPKTFDIQSLAVWRKQYAGEIKTKDIADIVKKSRQ